MQMAATKTRKPAKTASKPKTPKRAKSPAKTTSKPRATQTPPVGRSKQTPADQKAAGAATVAMRLNVRGEGKRAPVNATQVALVRAVVGRKSTATLAKSLGFKTKAQLVAHSRGEIETMPEGTSRLLAEFSHSLSGAGASKIRGRKLTAILAQL